MKVLSTALAAVSIGLAGLLGACAAADAAGYPQSARTGDMAATRLLAVLPTADAPAEVAAGELKVGEYACYGSGGQIMAGLGFKVLPGNRYTDLDDGNAGTYTVTGSDIHFSGGHLEEIAGRDLKNGRFRVGAQADCEPF